MPDDSDPVDIGRAGRAHVQHISRPGAAPHTSAYGLPPEVVETAIRRLGFLGLIIAFMGPSGYLVELFTQPERVKGLFQTLTAALFLMAGLTVFVLAWTRRIRSSLLLDLGLIFEVVVAFAISLSENATPWPPEQEIRGISWNCLWISMYVVAIPGTYGKTILAAITAACMAPFGLLVASVVNDNPLPTGSQTLLLLGPPIAAAIWAVPVARHFYRLGTQVSKARAMGAYELIELIGKGGMGEVWKARHRMLARLAAVKLVRPEALAVDSAANARVTLRRFEREARATAALRSPHTIALFDYGVSKEGSFYYVMELLDGLDLESLVRRFGPLPAGRVVYLLRQAAKSLAEAHDSGIIHRDIKPRNLFVCRMGTDYDFVKVLDFGLVKLRTAGKSQTELTGEGVTAGTPAYMSPEVAMGKPDIDGRADIYSLGCVGYWLLTGRLVFEAENAMGMVISHVQSPPVPPSQKCELPVPASLERIILQCLEKDPAARPDSGRHLLDMLRSCDGVEPWTQQDAGRWWCAHLPKQDEHPHEPDSDSAGETL